MVLSPVPHQEKKKNSFFCFIKLQTLGLSQKLVGSTSILLTLKSGGSVEVFWLGKRESSVFSNIEVENQDSPNILMNYVRASTTHHSICFLLRRVQVCQKWEKLFLPLERTSTLFFMKRYFWYCFSNSCLAPPPAHMTRVSTESENGLRGCLNSRMWKCHQFPPDISWSWNLAPHQVCVCEQVPASQPASHYSVECVKGYEIYRGLGRWRQERFWGDHLERFLNPRELDNIRTGLYWRCRILSGDGMVSSCQEWEYLRNQEGK